MFASKADKSTAPADVSRPYPSWIEVSGVVGTREGMEAVDRQAQKEARIWRDLADEPRQDGVSGYDGHCPKDYR